MENVHTKWFLSILLCAITALYGQFLSNPLIFDDQQFFLLDSAGNQPVDNFHFSFFELRSLPYATLAWGKNLFGLDLLHFRVENLLLHAAVTISLFFFLVKLFDVVYGARPSQLLSSRMLAFCGALLFSLHPVAVYATGYLVQRTTVMATFFGLITLLTYLHCSVHNKAAWMWAVVPFYYLAVSAKEHAIMLPVVLVALTVLLHRDWYEKLRQIWLMFFALLIVAAFVVSAKLGLIGSVYEPIAMIDESNKPSYLLSIFTQSWLFFKYLALWVFPNPSWMSIDMREPFAQSPLSIYLFAFLAFVSWGCVAIWLLFRRGQVGLVGFAMLFPWLMFMTEFSTVRIQEIFVLYRSYLWAVGAACVLPALLDRFDKRIAWILVIAISVAMFPISMDRLSSFGHSLILWNDAEKLVKNNQNLPGVYRIYHNRGTEFIKTHQYDLAIKDLALAVKLQPNLPYSYSQLGAAYLYDKQWSAAINSFSSAIEIAKHKKMGVNTRPYYGRAIAYEELSELEMAKKDYFLTCKFAKMGCEKLK